MSKKLFALLAAALFLLSLSSCTVAGAELALVGKWKSTKVTMNNVDVTSTTSFETELKNDDTYITKMFITNTLVNTEVGKVTKADSTKKTITMKSDASGSSEITYDYVLSGKKLTISGTYSDGTKVEIEYEKQ